MLIEPGSELGLATWWCSSCFISLLFLMCCSPWACYQKSRTGKECVWGWEDGERGGRDPRQVWPQSQDDLSDSSKLNIKCFRCWIRTVSEEIRLNHGLKTEIKQNCDLHLLHRTKDEKDPCSVCVCVCVFTISSRLYKDKTVLRRALLWVIICAACMKVFLLMMWTHREWELCE